MWLLTVNEIKDIIKNSQKGNGESEVTTSKEQIMKFIVQSGRWHYLM